MASIDLDPATRCYYAGVAAGAEAADQMRESGWDAQGVRVRRNIYWFLVGTKFDRTRAHMDASTFIQGAALRSP